MDTSAILRRDDGTRRSLDRATCDGPMTSDEHGFAARGEVDIACRVVTSSGDTPELSATRCRACGGRIEATIVSGPVLRRRRRLIALGGASLGGSRASRLACTLLRRLQRGPTAHLAATCCKSEMGALPAAHRSHIGVRRGVALRGDGHSSTAQEAPPVRELLRGPDLPGSLERVDDLETPIGRDPCEDHRVLAEIDSHVPARRRAPSSPAAAPRRGSASDRRPGA